MSFVARFYTNSTKPGDEITLNLVTLGQRPGQTRRGDPVVQAQKEMAAVEGTGQQAGENQVSRGDRLIKELSVFRQ